MENMIINRMNLLLLKEAKNLYEGLVLQKNKLNAELANTTYQAVLPLLFSSLTSPESRMGWIR